MNPDLSVEKIEIQSTTQTTQHHEWSSTNTWPHWRSRDHTDTVTVSRSTALVVRRYNWHSAADTVVFRVFLCFTDCCFFQWHFIDLFSCVAASLFNKLTYLLTYSHHSILQAGRSTNSVKALQACGPIYKIFLRQSYDNAKVTIDVSFIKHLTKNARLFSGTVHLQNRKIVWDSVRKLAYNIPRRTLSTL